VTNEIQQNRWDRMVRRVAGIIGPGSKVSEVITELFPMINVEEPPSELYLLGGTVLGSGGLAVNAAAGLFPKIQLFNPVDSGQLVTVTDVYASTSVISGVTMSRGTTTLASQAITALARDTRQIASSLPTAQMFFEQTAGLINAALDFQLLGNTTLHLHSRNDVMVLAPGTGLSVGASTAGATLHITFLWRERPAEPSELSL